MPDYAPLNVLSEGVVLLQRAVDIVRQPFRQPRRSWVFQLDDKELCVDCCYLWNPDDSLASPDGPIQTTSFALSDGTPMHSLDALEMYTERVARHLDRIDLRVRYGNTLRTLERDSTAIEALFNVAALRGARGETQAARFPSERKKYQGLPIWVACDPEYA
ncbi:MAG: hypothetical protein JSV36_16105 [Anaerolineae bacterium]|nr:MAG: hypothetical protein JSV36_16105 [Anaerolineae bacterium]